MFKLYSKGCQYALRALVLFASREDAERFRAAEICQELDVPVPFTRKIFQSLVQAGLLRAHRGPNGGYALVRSAKEITLLEIIHAVEGKDTFNHCVMGFDQCNASAPCPLHHVWLTSKHQLITNLSSTTLHDLSTALRGSPSKTANPKTLPRA